nr:MAG TPA: hypothetical protein [Caudoviricetes sp.]DAK19428.1 MAG TPA: hypothetical protein [Caudoviricetes sp.]DAT04905.1 MAG TPA: hypothetical protein [Caudoviricetes sp.]DAX66992.1 MAG TPA: hypothetical protein [Caudoviricetes sp.]
MGHRSPLLPFNRTQRDARRSLGANNKKSK